MSFSEPPSTQPKRETDPNIILDSVDLDAPISYVDPFDEMPNPLLLIFGFKKFNEDGAIVHNIKRTIQWIVVYIVLSIVLPPALRLLTFLESWSTLACLALFLGFLLSSIPLSLAFTLGPPWLVESIFKNAHYNRAIAASYLIPYLGFGLSYQAITRSYAGNWEQSERRLRRHLRKKRSNETTSNLWESLGNILLAQGRYTEALDCLEKAIAAYPMNAEAYNSLADIYLFQRLNPQRAFGLVERALAVKGKQHHTNFERHFVAELLISKGWAFQLLGDNDAAKTMIESALAWTYGNYKPILASVHFRTGKIRQLQANRVEAQKSFRQAVDIDPNGKYGILAQQALNDM